MRKSISLLLSAIMIVFAAFIPVIGISASNETRYSQTLNSYDDGNFYYEVDADVVTRAFNVNADGSKGRLNNLFSCNMAVANGNGIDGGIGVKSKNIICTTSDPANWLNMVRIYDSNLKNTLFKPKAGATYKISFKYKTTETETRDINFGIRGLINATGNLDQKNSKSIALLATHTKNAKATGDWKTVNAVFSVSDTAGYNGLSFAVYVTDTGNYIPNGDVFIDDIEIAEYVPDYTLNDYDGGNFYYEVDADVVTRAFNVNADGSKGRLNNLFSCNMAVANGNGIDGGIGVKSKNIICTTSDPANWLNMVRIYDSNLKNTLFKPKAGATYKISFKYKTTETETRDINFGIRGLINATGNLDQKNTKSIALLASHAKNTKATGDWKTVSAVFSIPETSQYNGLGFSVYVTGSANYIPNGDVFIDDIEIEIRETKYVSVVCHDFSENGEDKIINILNTANFDELEVPYVAGKKFDGWYLDSKLSKPAVGEIGKTAEVWVKWRTEPISIVNNYDESGIFYIKESYNYITRSTSKNGTDNIDSELSFSKFANGTFTENGGVNGSRAFGFTSASHSKNDYPVAVRVYDSGSAGKQLFIPQKNTTYRIKLKYNLPEHLNWADLYLSVNGMTAQSGAFGRGDELAKVIQIWRDSEIATEQWLEATATFTTGDTDYEGLGLFFATLNNETVDVKLWIDDIEITKVTYPYGDVNMDEKVDIRDLVRLKKISVGEAPETATANMDDDPAINATDISILRKLLLGISDEITVNFQTGISEGTGDSKSPVRSLWKALGMVNDGGTIHIEGVYSVSEADVIAGGKRVTVTGGTLDFTKIDSVKLGGAFTFRDINIRWQDGCEVFACGNAVTIAESVNITGVPAALYGGAAGGTIEETNLRVLAGNYKVIYGGSGGGIITGDTNLYIGGSANSNAVETSHNTDYIIFGGSNSGTVMGSTHLTLAGGKANYSYGGGANSPSSVRGTCFTELCGMRLMSVYGGSRSGGEVSATDIVMTSGWCEQIFGGSEHSPIIGKTEINLTGGTVVRRIYGGCYDSNSANFVTGTTTVRLGGSVNYTGNYVGWGENTICAGSRIGNRAEEVSSLYIETQELYDSLKEKIGRYTGYGCDYLYIAGIKQ